MLICPNPYFYVCWIQMPEQCSDRFVTHQDIVINNVSNFVSMYIVTTIVKSESASFLTLTKSLKMTRKLPNLSIQNVCENVQNFKFPNGELPKILYNALFKSSYFAKKLLILLVYFQHFNKQCVCTTNILTMCNIFTYLTCLIYFYEKWWFAW